MRTFYPAFIMEHVDPDFVARIARRHGAKLAAVDGVMLERLSELHKISNIEAEGIFCFEIAAQDIEAATGIAAQIEAAVYQQMEAKAAAAIVENV
jgi:hypothetical protein